MSTSDKTVRSRDLPQKAQRAKEKDIKKSGNCSVNSVHFVAKKTFYESIASKLLSALVLMAAACGGPHLPTAGYLPSHTRENQSFSGPHLGQEVKPEEIAAWDISIPPDGSGLPPGGGTASEGEAVYNAKCAGCHGVEGIKGPADPLVGGEGSLASMKPVKTVGSYWPYATTLFDYIRRAMPYSAPQSLSNDEVYEVSAYLLFLNGIIEREARMDAKTLPQVKMPNRDGFVSYWP